MRPPSTRLRQLAVWLGALAGLALVFWSYLQPDLVFALANQLWACF